MTEYEQHTTNGAAQGRPPARQSGFTSSSKHTRHKECRGRLLECTAWSATGTWRPLEQPPASCPRRSICKATVASYHHSIAASQHRSIAASQHHSIMASWHNSTQVPLRECRSKGGGRPVHPQSPWPKEDCSPNVEGAQCRQGFNALSRQALQAVMGQIQRSQLRQLVRQGVLHTSGQEEPATRKGSAQSRPKTAHIIVLTSTHMHTVG